MSVTTIGVIGAGQMGLGITTSTRQPSTEVYRA